LDDLAAIRTLLLIFESRSLPVRGGTRTERRPAVPELRSSVPIDASLYTRALLIRLTWGAWLYLRAKPTAALRSYGPV